MNVRELRKELKKFPKDHEVMTHDTDYGLEGDVEVYLDNYKPLFPLDAETREVVVIR